MELKVQKRQPGKVKTLLKNGIVPGIVYSKHIKEPIMVQFNKIEFIKLYEKAGSSSIITLKGDEINQLTLIHNLQIDPVKSFLTHVDFLGVKQGEKVNAEVPIILEGEEILKKNNLKANLINDHVEIQAIPSKLPHDIKIDVGNLEDGSNMHIRDLSLGKDIEVLTDPENVILTIYNPEEEATKQEEKDAAKEAEIEKAQEEMKEEGEEEKEEKEEEEEKKE